MRIINYKNSEGRLETGLADSFGITLNQKLKSHLGVSHLEFEQRMFDSHELLIGIMLKEYDKFGAMNVKGEIYADFIYNKLEGVCRVGYGSIGDESRQEVWMGKKDNDLYDIFHLDELIYEDAISRSHLVLDAYTKDDRNYQYVQIVTDKGFKIYDIFNKQFLNFTTEDAICFIHSKYQKVIAGRSKSLGCRKYEYSSTLIDFDGNILGKYTAENYLRFTEKEDFFEIYHDGKSGLVKLVNGVFEEVIPMKYRKILQIFDNKAVVINSQNCVKIVYFEKKMKKGVEVWINKLDSYKFPKEVISGFFLEDESEGILTLSNGMKILLSHYLQGNDEKFYCEDIFYEGNNIFKCFQFRGKQQADITFICNGQAVMANSKDKNGHYVELNINYTKTPLLFSPDGKLFDSTFDDFNEFVPVYGNKFFTDNTTIDFVTIPKDEHENLMESYGSRRNIIVNTLKGTFEPYRYSEVLVWHNLYVGKDNYDYHVIRGDDSIVRNIGHFVAGFNDYAVFSSFKNAYILDRNFNVTEISFKGTSNVRVDEIYRMCVISTEQKSYVVSNNGVEEFNNTGRIMILPSGTKTIYQSPTSGNYVVGNLFVDKDVLKYEAMNGTIESKYATL